MTKDLDDGIATLLQKVVDLGIENNTYIIFTSDNGAGQESNSAPLRGSKSFIYEGGIRVPLIIKGPNIPAGSNCDEPVVGYDFYPAIAALSTGGSALPSDLDGQDISPLFFQNNFTRSEPLYFHIPHYAGNGNIKKPSFFDRRWEL